MEGTEYVQGIYGVGGSQIYAENRPPHRARLAVSSLMIR